MAAPTIERYRDASDWLSELLGAPVTIDEANSSLAAGERRYPIENGVIRFRRDDGYNASFAMQWKAFRLTQYDHVNGTTLTRNRYERGTGWPLVGLDGETILEAGCGAGRFTRYLGATGARLVSIDYSAAVDVSAEMNGDHDNILFAQALTWLSQARPNRLVELGCGEGHFFHQARRFATEVVGTELNPDAARKCRLNGLEVHEATVDDLDGRFDVITSFQLMEHVDNPGEIVERCVSKLRHDGALIVSVPNQDGIIGELEEDFLNLPPHHASRWERSCFDYIAGHHGLVLEHYAQEPLTFELYANWSFEKLKRLNVGSRLLGRLYNRCVGLLHRALLPGAFAHARGFLSGHTHLAILRKVSDTGRAE